MKNVLILKAGEAAAPVRQMLGDYDRWFVQGFGPADHRFDVVHPYLGEKPPGDIRGYDAIVMTGSPYSVTRRTQWMERSAEYLVSAAAKGVPVLGVCFGHQLLGWAYGSQVIRNPSGRETGTVQVSLTEEGSCDPLFAGFPSSFAAQATHEDVVETAPPGAQILATNANTKVQAMAIGELVRGVQFHPEFEPEGLSAIISARETGIAQDGESRGLNGAEYVRSLKAGIRATPFARKVLSNFLENFT